MKPLSSPSLSRAVVALLLVVAAPAAAPAVLSQDGDVDPAPEVVVVPPPAEFEPLHHELYDRVSAGDIGCLSILVARDGEVLWEQGFGWANPDAGRPASSSTVYPVASVSKGLVGLAAALLASAGKLDLDDPVSETLTSFELTTAPWLKTAVRVRDLAQMTASMPHGGMIWTRDHPATAREGSWRAVRSFAVVDAEPGSEFRYSNYTYGVLEAVVEDVSGESLDDYLRRRVFAPLGMSSTRALPALEDPLLVQVSSGGQALEGTPFLTPSGGQGFYSSVKDLARLAELHLQSELCEEIGVSAEAVVGSRSPDGAPAVGPGGYWMGWGRFEHEERLFEVSNGQGFDATSCIVLFPEERAFAICLTDTQWYGSPGGDRLADVVAMRAMDAAVGDCTAAFEAARSRFEAEQRLARERRTSPAPIRSEGNWRGTLRLEGADHPARLEVGEGGSATLAFGPITASGQLRDAGGRLEGTFACSGRIELFGEESELSELALRLSVIAPERLGGSALFQTPRTGRRVVGSGGALLDLSRQDDG